MNDQTIKFDAGKLRLSLVPTGIMAAIARVREYGVQKYGDSDNWKRVEPERYRDAMLRHTAAYLDDNNSVDAESGLPHLWHTACNIAFLIALDREREHIDGKRIAEIAHRDFLTNADREYLGKIAGGMR